VILLEESWSELFLLCAVQWSLPMEASPLFAVADQVAHPGGTASHSGTGSATSGCAGASGGSGKSGGHHVHSDMRILQEVTTRFKVLQVDPAEFACHKAIVLFKPGSNFVHILIHLFVHSYPFINVTCQNARTCITYSDIRELYELKKLT